MALSVLHRLRPRAGAKALRVFQLLRVNAQKPHLWGMPLS